MLPLKPHFKRQSLVLAFSSGLVSRTQDDVRRVCVRLSLQRLAAKTPTMKKQRRQTPSWRNILALVALLWATSILYFIHRTEASLFVVIQWSIAQWIPRPFSSSLGRVLQENAWNRWSNAAADNIENILLDCPTLDLFENLPIESLVMTVEAKYGKDWRDRPLLLKGLWSPAALQDENRRLSIEGLLHENLTIPYFVNASAPYALSPDAKAPISEIVQNMTRGKPHKIGTQFLVQTYPELIKEVAPADIVTALFGDYFQPSHVVGSGPFGFFPAITTVPVFVARTGTPITSTVKDDTCTNDEHPRTDLHCEPIGNVAVQLQGEKQWMLISPEHSFRLQPAAAPDGRAFFASFAENTASVPQYHVTTGAGDALWIPTWTWHRVDYIATEEDVAIGGSLFHFRATDFLRNNPLYAMLIIPSLVKELVGYNTQ